MDKIQYKIRIGETALNYLLSVPVKVRRQIRKKIDSLKDNPRPPSSKRLKANPELYRIRSGDYRIIYAINDNEILVSVVKIGNRKDIYKKL